VNAAALERALAELRDASEELWGALRRGDLEELVGALERRESAIRGVSHGPGPPSLCARLLLAEVERGDRDALRVARARLEAVRLELAGVRQARAALARTRSSPRPARFVSERV
jgi:hypothetical protein